MPKFKAGDKVRVVSVQSKGLWYADKIGKEFTVGSYTGGEFYLVEEAGPGIWAKDLELVTTPKSMLKNGMRVKCRNGEMFTFIDDTFVAITSNFEDHNYLEYLLPVSSSSWTDNLENTYGQRFDVMEIFDTPTDVYLYFKYGKETPSVWKRVEKSVAELRLEQMQTKAAELQEEMAKLQKDIAEGKA